MAFNLGAISGALDDAKAAPPGVDFSGRSLKLDNENDAKGIVDAINACPSLRSLDLTGNTLGVGAAEAIARALQSRPELERARCSDMFTGRMKTEIPPALAALGNGMITAGARLSVLELSDNAFGPIGVEGLAKLLQSSVCSQLQELRLNNNGLGITGGKLLAGALLGAGRDGAPPPRLKVFIAGRNRLENDGARALAEVFQKMGSLVEIAMPQNGIYHVGVSALCEAFGANPGLRTLNLNDNTIGPKGARAFAKVLPRLRCLRALNFGDCLLKSRGALELAKAFRESDVLLEVLDVSHNEIGSAACSELVDAISRLPDCLDRLDRVVLAGNRLGGAASKKSMREKLGASAALSDGEDGSDDENDDALEDEESDDDSSEHTESCASDEEHESSRDVTALETSGVEEVLTEPARFLREPTLDNFKRLGASPADALDKHLQAIPDKVQAIDAYVEATMLVSGLAASSPAETAPAARELYACTVRRAGERHAAQWLLTNCMLVHLALIKSESKTFRVRWNLAGCYSVLSEVIVEPFFPESLRDTIRFFAKSKRDRGGADADIGEYPNLCC